MSQQQTQKQQVPPDPAQEQKQSYTPPQNALASDPITEAPKVEPPKAAVQQPAKQTQEQKH